MMDSTLINNAKAMKEHFLFHSPAHEQAFIDSPTSEIVHTEGAILFVEEGEPMRQVYFAYETPEDLRRALGGLAGVASDGETFKLAVPTNDIQSLEYMKKTLKRAGALFEETNIGMRNMTMNGKRGIDTSIVERLDGDDSEELFELIMQTIGYRRFAMSHEAFNDYLNDSSTLVVGIKDHGHVVAFATAQLNNESTQLFIRGLGVNAEHLRKGYAKKVLQTMLDTAHAHGMRRAMLWVEETNKQAIKLYESFGFELNGELEALFTYKPRMHSSF